MRAGGRDSVPGSAAETGAAACRPLPQGVPLARDRRGATLALLSFAMLIVSLDQYIVVVALPSIGRALGYSSQTLQSVISAYAVASSGFLLFGGRATDLLGRRRILVTGLALYAVASLAGGLARGPELQLTARAAQGLGGALVFWPSLTPPSQKGATATAPGVSGAVLAPPAWSSVSC